MEQKTKNKVQLKPGLQPGFRNKVQLKPSEKSGFRNKVRSASKAAEYPRHQINRSILLNGTVTQDNTMVDMSKTKSKAEYNSYEEIPKTFNDFFPSNINMAGTSMGSYDKPMMKGSELKMCGSQVGKHMKR